MSQDTVTARLNTRVFFLGVNPETLRRDADFIPLNRVAWIDSFLSADPHLQGAVVHIRARPQPVTQQWAFPGPGLLYKFSGGIPKKFFLDGYRIRSTKADDHVSFMYLPDSERQNFSVTCTVDRVTLSEFSFCVVTANYPLDANLFVQARIYQPEKYEDLSVAFREISERIRNVAYCLDVTDLASSAVERSSILGKECSSKMNS
ncbi:hypothetical protein [Leisingera caerulea]|uniref:hypothetical protein n=1 Tax=Leisingera caerulea TaxID=506591 RepID=UPI0021A6DE67|nr:hypothetical protein [Leisingera caerulea]